jgi:hypothetical protein
MKKIREPVKVLSHIRGMKVRLKEDFQGGFYWRKPCCGMTSEPMGWEEHVGMGALPSLQGKTEQL